MELCISKKQGVFELKGKITIDLAHKIMYYFEPILNGSDTLNLSLNEVTYMDSSVANVFVVLYHEALKTCKEIKIIGESNFKVNKAFGAHSYLLSA